jgi:hypothetical protein
MSRPITADVKGQSLWIDREAIAMDEQQVYRELIQNGFEAGASEIIIDGWPDPETGHTLARVTDDGSGMSEKQLVKHLSTLHVRTKGTDNYGVGARIAGLSKNPAGLSFASRTKSDEGMIRLVKERGIYVVQEWPVEIEGYEQLLEVVAADEGELNRLGKTKTGTAVILHGKGRADTWNTSAAYKAHKFLSERYYQFPESTRIRVAHPKKDEDGTWGLKRVKPFGQFLAEEATADGEIPFTDVAGFSGHMFWWILPKYKETLGGLDRRAGGVGIVAKDEIFDYSSSYSADFGVIYTSVAKQVAILIRIDQASMETGRAGVVLPGRKTIPWKKLGQHFAAHMPPEIDELLSAVTVSSSSFDAKLAKLLDEDWMKKLNPVDVPVKAVTGEALVGDDPGEGLPVGDDTGGGENPHRPAKPRKAAQRTQAGDESGKRKPKVVTPNVEFLPRAEVDQQKLITYLDSANTLQIADEFPPYVREIARGIEESGHSQSVVKAAVQSAYAAEFAATIIDANGQSKHGIGQDVIEKLKSDEALYAKALGFQSLSERVRAFIKEAVKAA